MQKIAENLPKSKNQFQMLLLMSIKLNKNYKIMIFSLLVLELIIKEYVKIYKNNFLLKIKKSKIF